MFRPRSAFVPVKIRNSSSPYDRIDADFRAPGALTSRRHPDQSIGELAMAITDSISPLDDGFMRLGHVAMLMAEENERRAYEDIMDRFKRAVFAGELEPPHIFTPDRDNPVNWLHMEIVIPPVRADAGAGCTRSAAQALLRRRPRDDRERAVHERRVAGQSRAVV